MISPHCHRQMKSVRALGGDAFTAVKCGKELKDMVDKP
jgi:hypothetical protein